MRLPTDSNGTCTTTDSNADGFERDAHFEGLKLYVRAGVLELDNRIKGLKLYTRAVVLEQDAPVDGLERDACASVLKRDARVEGIELCVEGLKHDVANDRCGNEAASVAEQRGCHATETREVRHWATQWCPPKAIACQETLWRRARRRL